MSSKTPQGELVFERHVTHAFHLPVNFPRDLEREALLARKQGIPLEYLPNQLLFALEPERSVHEVAEVWVEQQRRKKPWLWESDEPQA